MKTKNRSVLFVALCLLALFALWTLLVCVVDVRPIGSDGSDVGFSTLNQAFHRMTGVHWLLYSLTDWLGLFPLAIVLSFAMLGLVQWIKRKSLRRVDRGLLVMGVFYLTVLAVFALFETAVVNVRPILINGVAEASYPSSTTMLATCVLPTAMLWLRARIRPCVMARIVLLALGLLTAFLVVGRLFSGVHWLSDIIGGILISAGLVALYAWACSGQV